MTSGPSQKGGQRKRRKALRIGAGEAIRRLKLIADLLRKDLLETLRVEAMHRAANEMALALEDELGPSYVAHGFNIVTTSLTRDLALRTARFLDVGRGRPINQQDKAAIPALIHYLSQKRCQDPLIQEARLWKTIMADANAVAVKEAIEYARVTYADIRRSSRQRARLKAIRALRDSSLAHLLFDQEAGQDVLFRDMYETLDVATRIIAAASFAADGKQFRVEECRREFRRQALAFWTPVLNAGRAPPRAQDEETA